MLPIRLLVALMVVHGLIHLMGFARGWGLGDGLPMAASISRGMGLVWLGAAVLLIGAAVAILVSPTRGWRLALAAAVLSQVVIVTAWQDARVGTLANVVIALVAAVSTMGSTPSSFRQQFARAEAASVRPDDGRVVESDLARLPTLVQRYLRVTGVVGQPRVHSMHARFRGRIRAAPDARWMSYVAQQYTDFDAMARYYLLDASMFGVPIQAYHVYAGPHATMRVKAANLIPVANASGPELDVSETVTFLNDMVVWAPAALIGASIKWEEHSDSTVVAVFTNAGHTVRAELTFASGGELVHFRSEDRGRSDAGGTFLGKTPWTTPLTDYRTFGAIRVSGRGEARWHTAEGEWVYADATVERLEYNTSRLAKAR